MADGPWVNYKPQAQADSGPWQNYQPQAEEGYFDKEHRLGEAVNKAAGTGIAGVGRSAVAAGEVAAQMGSSLVGDVAGAATSVATQDPKKGEKVRSAMTYEPRTETGKAASAYVGALTEPLGKALDYVPHKLEESGHPILGQTARAAIDVAGGKKALEARKPPVVSPLTRSAEMVKQARQAGYVLKPSEAGGKIGTAVEGVTGSPRLSSEASIKNQVTTNKLNAQDIGVKPGERLKQSTLDAAKKPHQQIYKVVEGIGSVPTDAAYKSAINAIGRTPGKSFKGADRLTPDVAKLRRAYREKQFDSKDAVMHIRQLRADARREFKSDLPKDNAMAAARLQVATALEEQIDRHAQVMGYTDLIPKFRAARQALAKIATTEDVLVGEDVSAKKLARLQSLGVPLSGNQKLIADVATEFKEVTRDAHDVKNKTPTGAVEGMMGIGGAVATAMHSPHVGVPLIGGMVARPLVRKALLSDMYQDRLGK